MMNTIHFIKTPAGNLKLIANDDALIACHFTKNIKNTRATSPILKLAESQLQAYFKKKLTQFDVPLEIIGTDFQKTVWNALLQIPYGDTKSYQAVAADIDKPNASRAVGSANGKNPLCIFIPCHRVIRASGDIGGYSGGIIHKIKLLALEKS